MNVKNHNRQLFSLIVLCSTLTLFANTSLAAIGSNWIEQWGIRWTFDKNLSTDGVTGTYRYGTFANGDYWIIGPVNIIEINPPSTEIDGRIKNGSMINPSPTNTSQGYDNTVPNNTYDADLNVAFDVDAGNPLTVMPGSSLVSTISINAPAQCTQIKSASILTVLSSVPIENSFRPPYCGTDKSIQFNVSDLDYSKLASLTVLDSVLSLHKDTLDDPSDQDETVERMFERPWIDHRKDFQARDMHPEENMPEYGREMTIQIGQAALMLHLNYSNAQKETLLIRFVQLGLDFYGVIQDGGKDNWIANGGHTRGRKMPILFASLVLNDSSMQDIFQKTGDYLYDGAYGPGNPPPDLIHFSEDDQIFYVKDEDIFNTPYHLNHNGVSTGTVDVVNGSNQVQGHGTGWGSGVVGDSFVVENGVAAQEGFEAYKYEVVSINTGSQIITLDESFAGNTDNGVSYAIADKAYFGHGHPGNHRDYEEYTTEHKGMPEFGYDHAGYLFEAGLDWDANYRAGRYTGGHVLTVLIMGAKTLWNHNAWFDYEDRFVSIEKENENPLWLQTKFTRDMWDAYRADYGPIWPDTENAPPIEYTLTITPDIVNGNITKSPDKAGYTAGETVTLTATPATGYTFSNWSGSIAGTANPTTITMNSNKTVTADFTQNTPPPALNTYYISPNGSAGNTGGDWNDALRNIPLTLDRGATYYIAAGSYSSYVFQDTPSGTEYITLKKATEADHGTSTGWQSAYGSNAAIFAGFLFNNASYINLDGQQENGIKIEWDSSGAIGGRIIDIQNSDHLSIRYCEIDGKYAAQSGTQTAGGCTLINLGGSADITIENCVMHDAADDGLQISSCSGLTFNYNEIYNLYGCGTDSGCGPCFNGHSDGIEIYNLANGEFIGNFVHNISMTSCLFMRGSGTCSNLLFANNIFYNNMNAGFTAYIQFVDGIELYNNVFWGRTDGSYGGLSIGTNVSDMEIYNNVILSINYSHMGAVYNATEHRGDYNIFGADVNQYPEQPHDQIVSDPGFIMINGASGPLIGDVVKEDFMLETNSLCINTGTAVSVTSDILGTLRPRDGAFDIGAFEVQSGSAPTTYTLSINATNGSVIKSPDKTSYTEAETVTLTATPDADYTFANWSDGTSGTTNPITITMNSNKTVTANFEVVVIPGDPVITPVSVMESETGFDKVNDYKEVSLNNASAASGTISLWAYGYDYSSSAYLFGHTVGTWSNRIQLYLSNGVLNLGLGGTHSCHTNIQLLEPNRWYFLTLSWDGTTYTVYVDGQQKATGTYTGLTALNTFADAGNTGNPDSRTGEVFHGRIDDVKIYDTALSSTNVALFYAEGRNGGLAGYFKMDDSFDNTSLDIIEDDSGKNLEPTTINSPQHTDAWAEEYCLRFNSSGSQAVEISCESLQPQAGTIALWAEPEISVGHKVLFGHFSAGSGNAILLYTEDGRLGVEIGDVSQLTTDTLEAGVMQHVALTWNGTEYAIYLEGEQRATGTFSGLTALAATADIANVGSATYRSLGLGFDGIVDDVQIYSRALSAQEITTLFNTQEAKENRVLTFFISGQDQNGNPYTYTTQNLPAGAAFDQGEQKLTWRPWYDQAGDHQVLFISLDGADEQTVTLSVKDVTLRDWYREFLAQNGKL